MYSFVNVSKSQELNDNISGRLNVDRVGATLAVALIQDGGEAPPLPRSILNINCYLEICIDIISRYLDNLQ